MQDGIDRLGRDVAILEAMAGQMAQYLDSDILFWPMAQAGMPMLTLGGYLMREHRLNALGRLLTAEQQAKVEVAGRRFNEVLANRLVRFEGKAQHELPARLRQWEEFLKDVERGAADRSSNYTTAVETRVMIAGLMNRLSLPPYQTPARAAQHLALLDTRLRNVWQPGEFVWPAEWLPAYPVDDYWFLHGAPRTKESNG